MPDKSVRRHIDSALMARAGVHVGRGDGQFVLRAAPRRNETKRGLPQTSPATPPHVVVGGLKATFLSKSSRPLTVAFCPHHTVRAAAEVMIPLRYAPC